MSEPVSNKVNALNTEHVAAAVVIGALLILILIRKGFRGVSVGGATLSVS